MRWFLLALALTVGMAQSQEPQKTPKAKQKPAAEQRGTENAPIFVKIPGPTTQAERDHEAYEKHQKPWNETALAYATVGLAAITLGLAIFTALLWNATRKLVSDAKDTSQKQMRAYLGVRRGIISVIAEGHLQAIIEVHNTGSTPAHHVTKAINLDIRDATQPGAFPMPSPHTGRWPIVPGAYWTFRREITGISPNALAEISQYKKALFVWGQAEYKDIFGKRQLLEFRYRNLDAHITVKPEGTIITGWELEPEEEGNSST